SFTVESWYPYTTNPVSGGLAYPRDITISVSNFAAMSLTNYLGLQFTNSLQSIQFSNALANSWVGGTATNSFKLPYTTNAALFNTLSNGVGVYVFGGNYFTNVNTNVFERPGNGEFPLPYWMFTISNRLTYLMSETAGGYERIVDFVSLKDEAIVDL